MAPETPIWDIVDCCRVWESHADTEAGRFSKPGPEKALPIYSVDELRRGVDDWMVAAVTIPPAAPDPLETLLRRLLPTPQTSAHGIGEDATTIAAGGADTKAHSTSHVWNY